MLPLLFLSAAPDPYNLNEIDMEMREPGVHVRWHWEDCGEDNAWYMSGEITLCNELRELDPGVVRFAFAHEYSHAIIHQLHIPFTGSEEVAADELAAVVLGVNGHADELMQAALYWYNREDDANPWDPHPSNLQRFYTLGCYALESAGLDSVRCDSGAWVRAIHTWTVLLP